MADRRDLLINLLGRETVSPAARRAGDATEDLGDDLRATARDAAQLDEQIEDLNRSLAALAVQHARTGDDSFARQIREQERELRKLARTRRLLGTFDDEEAHRQGIRWGAKIAEGIGSGLASAGGPISDALGKVFGTLPPQAQAAIGAGVIGAVASIAPFIGATIAGAVVGGAGIGGVVGGIKIAARHPEVKAAATLTGQTFAQVMERSAVSFVPATIGALGKVRAEIRSMEGDFEDIFSNASRFVEPLTDGLLGMVRGFLPGLKDAIAQAGPVINVIADGLKEIGEATGDLFSTMADHAHEGASALAVLFLVLEAGVRMVDMAVGSLATMYGWMVQLGLILNHDVTGLAEWQAQQAAAKTEGKGFAENLQELINGFAGVDATAAAATQEIETLAEMIDRLSGETLDARAANRNLEAAIDDATAAAKENGRTLDESTPKGRANAEALDAIARTAKQSAAAILTQTRSQELASEATEKGRAAFLEAADAMGVEEGEALALANQLFGIPKEVNTDAHFNPDNEGVKRWKETLSGIPRNIFIKAHFDLINDREVSMALRLGRLSAGGPVTGPGPKGVDSRPFLLAPGEHVLTAREVDAAGGHRAIEQWRKSLTHPASAGAASPAASSGSSFTLAQLVAAFRAGIAGMSVQLDGRTVGYIQGRQADIYARGG